MLYHLDRHAIKKVALARSTMPTILRTHQACWYLAQDSHLLSFETNNWRHCPPSSAVCTAPRATKNRTSENGLHGANGAIENGGRCIVAHFINMPLFLSMMVRLSEIADNYNDLFGVSRRDF